MPIDERQIVGDWVHSHEEDDASHRVFRRAGAILSRSRGRAAYSIGSDLVARRTGPGADDRPAAQAPLLVTTSGPLRSGELRVIEVSADRMLVARN